MDFGIRYHLTAVCLLLLTSACREQSQSDTPSAPPGTQLHTIEHNGITREYIAYIPDSYNADTPVPLLFNFHGYGGNASEFMAYADLRPQAEAHQFILVYPQGTLLAGTSHWNAALPGNGNKSSADDFGFIDALRTHLASQYQIDLNRVYAMGFSNGGMFSYALACYHSANIAAVAAVAATMLATDCSYTHPMGIISLHGSDDTVIPYQGNHDYLAVTQVLEYWINANGTETAPITRLATDNGTEITHLTYPNGMGHVSVEHYRVDGGGHSWFNFDFQGQSANQLLWQALAQYDIHGQRQANLSH